MSDCERCGEVNAAEIHTCTPQEAAPEVEFNPEPAVMLVLQSLQYAANVLKAIPFTPLHPTAMNLLSLLSGIFAHDILKAVKNPVDVQ